MSTGHSCNANHLTLGIYLLPLPPPDRPLGPVTDLRVVHSHAMEPFPERQRVPAAPRAVARWQVSPYQTSLVTKGE